MALASSYLIGSIPFPLIVARLVRGVDLREHGSGNMGAMNAARVLGTGPAVLVFLLDAAKGAAAAALGRGLAPAMPAAALLCLAAAAAGHVWPVFAGFRGGKALAACAGGLGLLAPWLLLMLLALFGLLLLTLPRLWVRRDRVMGVSGCLTAAAAVPLALWPWGPAGAAGILPLAAVVFWPHFLEAAGRRRRPAGAMGRAG